MSIKVKISLLHYSKLDRQVHRSIFLAQSIRVKVDPIRTCDLDAGLPGGWVVPVTMSLKKNASSKQSKEESGYDMSGKSFSLVI